MRNKIRFSILMLMMLFAFNSGYASTKIGNLYYNLNTTDKTAEVTNCAKKYAGNIDIPATVTDDSGITYSVTSIGNWAFQVCSDLTSITIPNSVTSIGNNAFWYCSGLTSITIPNSVTSIGIGAFGGCKGLTSITIPNSVTSIGNNAFGYCRGLTSINVDSENVNYSSVDGVLFNKEQTELIQYPCGKSKSYTIPNSVTSIGEYAFKFCSGLTSITIPNSVTSIGQESFNNCTSLTSVTIPNSVTSIGYGAFSSCTGLTSIDIPNSVTSIGSHAFEYCSSLTSITIPNSVTSIGYGAFLCSGLTSITIPNSVTSIENWTFQNCSDLTSITIPNSVTSIGISAFYQCSKLSILVIEGALSDYKCFGDLPSSTIVYAKDEEIDKIKEYFKGYNVLPISICPFSKIECFLCSLQFTRNDNDKTLVSIRYNNKDFIPDENGIYKLTGLTPNKEYNIEVNYKTSDGELHQYIIKEHTNKPTISVSCKDETQTTLTILMSASSDESVTPDLSFTCNGKTYKYTGSPIKVTGLQPKNTYSISSNAYYNNIKFNGDNVDFTTQSLNPYIAISGNSPTGFIATGSYTHGDAEIAETGFTGYGTGNKLNITGLEPETKYTITYYVKDKNGNIEKISKDITTPKLELTTLDPKAVSSSCAIVAASTNMSDEETNAGFQWKKYDAPSSLKPSEGYAAIYDGQLEGYIKNLQSTSFYNVRAFYKSAADKYYYGDWITFDPSDFSFFEPTVHTYPVQEMTTDHVKLKGYVMAGSDQITEQGFQYWKTGAGKNSPRCVNVALADNASDNVMTVLSTGQVMTVELKDLSVNTTYSYRAFVKTTSGVTYGEEQTFDTAGMSGIGEIDNDNIEKTVIGYYDLNGRRMNNIGKGITIIRYSDGSASKVMN